MTDLTEAELIYWEEWARKWSSGLLLILTYARKGIEAEKWDGDRYKPCPTCGFKIVQVERPPFVFDDAAPTQREEDDELESGTLLTKAINEILAEDAPEPVAPPAGDCNCKYKDGWGHDLDCPHVADNVRDDGCVQLKPSPSPAIGDVEKLIERLEKHAVAYINYSSHGLCLEASAMLRSLAAYAAQMTGKNDVLRAKLERAREGLRNVASKGNHEHWTAVGIARATLEELK